MVKHHMVQFNTGVHLVTGGTLYQKGGQQKAVSKTALLAVNKVENDGPSLMAYQNTTFYGT